MGNRLTRQRDEDLRHLGLTSGQAVALQFIEGHPGCQISDIAADLETTHQAARTLVDRLRAKGLVEVYASDSDGRARSITLSEDGSRRCGDIRRVGSDTAAASLSVLDRDERAALMSMLRRVSDNLRRCWLWSPGQDT